MADGKVKINGGKVLLVGGKVALADDCCCGPCDACGATPTNEGVVTTDASGDCDAISGTYTGYAFSLSADFCSWEWRATLGGKVCRLIVRYHFDDPADLHYDIQVLHEDYPNGAGYWLADATGLSCTAGEIIGEGYLTGLYAGGLNCTAYTAHVVLG